MRPALFAFVFILNGSAACFAGIVVELAPIPEGPYLGGELITVDFWLKTLDTSYYIRGVRFDFSDTSEALQLADKFNFDHGATPNPQPWMAWTNSSLPLPYSYMTLDCYCPSYWMLLLPDNPIHIGSMSIQIPDETGGFRLDSMNADEREWGLGALVWMASGASYPYWRAYTGEITGGTLDFLVVPEPTGLILGLAAWAAIALRPLASKYHADTAKQERR